MAMNTSTFDSLAARGLEAAEALAAQLPTAAGADHGALATETGLEAAIAGFEGGIYRTSTGRRHLGADPRT